MEQKKDGFISVGYSLDKTVIYDKKYDNAQKGEASIFALSANVKKADKDTTITSDYAMAYISEVTPMAIVTRAMTLLMVVSILPLNVLQLITLMNYGLA